MLEPLFGQGPESFSAKIERDVRVTIDRTYPAFDQIQASLHPLLSKRDCSKVHYIIADYQSGAGALRSYVSLEV